MPRRCGRSWAGPLRPRQAARRVGTSSRRLGAARCAALRPRAAGRRAATGAARRRAWAVRAAAARFRERAGGAIAAAVLRLEAGLTCRALTLWRTVFVAEAGGSG